MKRVQILIVVILLISNACVTQFMPDIDEYKNLLVVEGLITNEYKEHYVKLYRSNPVGSLEDPLTVPFANVVVVDNFGNETSFTERTQGYYATDSMSFEVGRLYTLKIVTSDDMYASDAMELRDVPPIDRLYAELQLQPIIGTNYEKIGYQIYVDTHDPSNETRFYRWEAHETWEVKLPRKFDWPAIVNKHCWTSQVSDRIYIENTSSLAEDQVSRYALNFVGTETPRLDVKYSVLLKQYALNKEEYLYWKNLRDQNEQVGGLYDPIPMPLPGNMESELNPARDVLGFFSVSGVSEKRIFINNDTLEKPNYYLYCYADTVQPGEVFPPGMDETYFILYKTDPPEVQYFLTRAKSCIDCAVFGTVVKPPYWEDDK